MLGCSRHRCYPEREVDTEQVMVGRSQFSTHKLLLKWTVNYNRIIII